MNIPELSTALANTSIQRDVSVAMLSKSLDNAETIGNSMVNMMNNSMSLSVNPAVGGNFDMYV